jgi:hypothetical protein
MSQGKLLDIHQRLSVIRKGFEEKQRVAKDNRDAAIALIKFVNETVEAIAPGEIKARWSGSFDNPGVVNFPRVTITAQHDLTGKDLGSWTIDSSGDYPIRQIAADMIMDVVLVGLERI